MDLKKILLNIWILIIFLILFVEIILEVHYERYNYKNYINFTKCLIKELVNYYNLTFKYE